MHETPAAGGHAGFKSTIDSFIHERMQAKLDKLKPDDPQRDEVYAAFARDVWLASAAKRVEQIQAVTHSLKPIHPDARGTNLYVEPAQLPTLDELGSRALGASFSGDVVGNAAALDVYKFLKLEVAGRSLLTALLANDEAAVQALHDDPEQASSWRDAFVSLTQPRTGATSSHPLAKQLYWLTGEDASRNEDYELLAPLFATSLAHAVHGEIQEHRFGDANKEARQAYRERKPHDGVFHHYPDLAVQKMGGTKPQNISQLNSERGGVNYLLSSLPPQWKASNQRLPVHTESVFKSLYGSRPEVRRTMRELRHFLESDPDATVATRDRRDALIDELLDELVSMAGELHQQPAGWTLDKERFGDLVDEEALWLDPMRALLSDETDFRTRWMAMDWPAEVAKRFALWLNAQLAAKLLVGDVEMRQWISDLLADEAGFLHQLRDVQTRMKSDKPSPGEGGAQ